MSGLETFDPNWLMQYGFAGFALWLVTRKINDLQASIDKLADKIHNLLEVKAVETG
jgi:hypothetical protein